MAATHHADLVPVAPEDTLRSVSLSADGDLVALWSAPDGTVRITLHNAIHHAADGAVLATARFGDAIEHVVTTDVHQDNGTQCQNPRLPLVRIRNDRATT